MPVECRGWWFPLLVGCQGCWFPLLVGWRGRWLPLPVWLTVPVGGSGADDLLPILSYVVLQTGLPQLLSECAALEEFIHEG